MKKKILLEGGILTRSGYAEHSKFVYRALKSREDIFDIYIAPLNWGKCSWDHEDTTERREIDQLIAKTHIYAQQGGQFDIHIFVGIANEVKKKAPQCILVTAGIETDKVSPDWVMKCNELVDKIIVPSEHAKTSFLATEFPVQDQFGNKFDMKLQKPIDVVSYPVKNITPKVPELDLEYDFNFLCVAQWSPRKNLENTIKWFLEEFNNDKVGLVLKVNISRNSLIDRVNCETKLNNILKDYKDRVCKIHLLHGSMNEEEMHGLYIHPKIKAMISFAHGEGFGLPLFEAAYSGLPIITHDYSGQVDFLSMPDDKGKVKFKAVKTAYDLLPIQKEAEWPGVLQPGSRWAYVKPIAAKIAMREVHKDYGRFKGQAKKLKEYLLKEITEEKMNEKMRNLIYEEENFDVEKWLEEMNVKSFD